MILSLVQLGRVDYREALALQEELTRRRQEGSLGDTLLLLEHPPVLTLGRNACRENILASSEALEQRGVMVIETNRGGDVTYHGPGQLVGYPILDLRRFNPRLGAVEYVRKLEEVLIRSCADYGILTRRIAGRTGVWTTAGGLLQEDQSPENQNLENRDQENRIQEKKIAAIGVHISRGVTSHGFALNVTVDLRDFAWIVPCGIADRGVTSIEEEIDWQNHTMPTMEGIFNSIARHFTRVFGHQVLWTGSVQALLAECREQ